MTMYKTLVLGLLEDRPQVHQQLRQQHMLLTAMEFYASELKQLHQAWTEHLSATRPGHSRIQEALEIALNELEGYLPVEPSHADQEGPFVEDLMGFLRDHSPPA